MAVKKKTEKKLTAKEEAFCQAYVRCLDKTKAARAAGYSEKTCSQIGYENFNKPYIYARINKLLQENIDIDSLEDTLASGLKNIVTFNITDVLDDEGNVDTTKLKELDIPSLVSGINTNQRYDKDGNLVSTNTAIKTVDPMKAVEILAKIKKIYDDKPEVNVTIPPINVNFK